MIQLDVSKCFDSIYTHSIAWAIWGKDMPKNVIAKIIKGSLSNSFADNFDKLIQASNYGETNGIPIGPEVSRIFSEIIMQHIDRETKKNLKSQDVIYGDDYEIFRYVDDYFIFYNDDQSYQKIINSLQVNLSIFKLGINFKKEKKYQKPIITDQTIAKHHITELLEKKLVYKLEILDSVSNSVSGTIHIDETSLIRKFKSILKTSNVSYDDTVNYTLAITEEKVGKILEDYQMINNDNKLFDNLIDSLSAILSFLFFIYSVSPKVNSTIKLVRILQMIISFLKSYNSLEMNTISFLYDQVAKDCKTILRSNALDAHAQIETLYLLNIMSQLGKKYRLTLDELSSYLGGIRKKERGVIAR